MNITEGIHKRRSTRSLSDANITHQIRTDLMGAASLAPSCFNKQPWRYVFIYDPDQLNKMFDVLSKDNEWAKKASMIIVVLSKKENDCIMKDGREYYLFDTGMSTAFILLKATELDLIAHPIAGFNIEKTAKVINCPDDLSIITLLIIGKKSAIINPILKDYQIEAEKTRPERFPFDKIIIQNSF